MLKYHQNTTLFACMSSSIGLKGKLMIMNEIFSTFSWRLDRPKKHNCPLGIGLKVSQKYPNSRSWLTNGNVILQNSGVSRQESSGK